MQALKDLNNTLVAPAFGFDEEKAIKPTTWDFSAAHKYLTHFVAQHPQALLQHVQRIHMAVMLKDSAKVHSALLDLFLVLGKKGKAIRAEMLALGMPWLSEHEQAFYFAHLNEGVQARRQHPEAPYSVLSLGLEGEMDVSDENAQATGASLLWCELDWSEIASLLEERL